MKIKWVHGSVELEHLKSGGTYIHSIIVDPDWRGRGYGRRLMEAALKKCCCPIYLLVSTELGSDYDRLVEFYKGFGFKKKCGREIGYNYNMVDFGQE